AARGRVGMPERSSVAPAGALLEKVQGCGPIPLSFVGGLNMDQNRRDLMSIGLAAGAVAAGTAGLAGSAAAQSKPEPRYVRHDPPRGYAKAVVVGNMIYLAGEDSKDPRSQKVQGTTTAEQTEITFQNIKATLEGLGSSLEHVIKTFVYLKD